MNLYILYLYEVGLNLYELMWVRKPGWFPLDE